MLRSNLVFISSRSDELSAERRAAYDATSSLGLTPLLFEAAPNRFLRTGQIWGGESEANVAKEQVDAFVDRADFFLGIYYNSIGAGEEILAGLPWIEYELLRFLTRHLYMRELGISASEVKKSNIDELMQRPQHVEWLLSALAPESRNSKRKKDEQILDEIVAEKMQVFIRSSHDEFFRSTRLSKLLSLVPRTQSREFRATRVPKARMVKDHLEVPAYIQMYNLILDAYGKHRSLTPHPAAVDEPRGELSSKDDGSLFLRVVGEDVPHVIYNIGRECFRAGLDLMSIVVTRDPPMQRYSPDRSQKDIPAELRVELNARSFGHSLCKDEQIKLRQELRESLERGFDVEIQTKPKQILTSNQHLFASEPGWTYAYIIDTIDVPGMLWNIVSTVASYGGNIDFLRSKESALSRSDDLPVELEWKGRVVSFDLGISPADRRESPSLSGSDGDSIFCYHLRQLPGVITVRSFSRKLQS